LLSFFEMMFCFGEGWLGIGEFFIFVGNLFPELVHDPLVPLNGGLVLLDFVWVGGDLLGGL
jgi:hypothetical protein